MRPINRTVNKTLITPEGTLLTPFRWEPSLALFAAGGIALALPQSLSVGPRWLLIVLVLGLLIPTFLAHKQGRHSLYHFFGIVSNLVITAALCGSLFLLVSALPARREPPTTLLSSAFLLWCANVLTFSLWYWRLDGGGPVIRRKNAPFGSRAFLFPQL